MAWNTLRSRLRSRNTTSRPNRRSTAPFLASASTCKPQRSPVGIAALPLVRQTEKKRLTHHLYIDLDEGMIGKNVSEMEVRCAKMRHTQRNEIGSISAESKKILAYLLSFSLVLATIP